ncbi:MAG: hypothetical protein DPW09_33680 [Anaerolineae bacterium]|nr:hypothetical protein [Anaerolineales bacterium]MCQ3978405.1 hypothetical protein [Anaerolineae bacterium]
MRQGKHFENEWQDSPVLANEVDGEDEAAAAAERRRYLRAILSRAVVVYLVLFMGLGFVMSAVGVNPLANNGLMPKALLVFVGLALLIALANTLTDLFREQGRNWLRLAPMREDTPARQNRIE